MICPRCGKNVYVLCTTLTDHEKRVLQVDMACNGCRSVVADADAASSEELEAADAMWNKAMQGRIKADTLSLCEFVRALYLAHHHDDAVEYLKNTAPLIVPLADRLRNLVGPALTTDEHQPADMD